MSSTITYFFTTIPKVSLSRFIHLTYSNSSRSDTEELLQLLNEQPLKYISSTHNLTMWWKRFQGPVYRSCCRSCLKTPFQLSMLKHKYSVLVKMLYCKSNVSKINIIPRHSCYMHMVILTHLFYCLSAILEMLNSYKHFVQLYIFHLYLGSNELINTSVANNVTAPVFSWLVHHLFVLISYQRVSFEYPSIGRNAVCFDLKNTFSFIRSPVQHKSKKKIEKSQTSRDHWEFPYMKGNS